jgi:hypothetical protein
MNIRKLRKSGFTLIAFLMLISLVSLLVALPVAAQVASTNPPATDTIGESVKGAVTPFVVQLVAKYTWVATVLLVIGIIRVCMKPVMMLVEAVIAATPSTSDDEALAKFEAGPVYKWILWGLDWLGSFKTPGAIRSGTTNPLIK